MPCYKRKNKPVCGQEKSLKSLRFQGFLVASNHKGHILDLRKSFRYPEQRARNEKEEWNGSALTPMRISIRTNTHKIRAFGTEYVNATTATRINFQINRDLQSKSILEIEMRIIFIFLW